MSSVPILNLGRRLSCILPQKLKVPILTPLAFIAGWPLEKLYGFRDHGGSQCLGRAVLMIQRVWWWSRWCLPQTDGGGVYLYVVPGCIASTGLPCHNAQCTWLTLNLVLQSLWWVWGKHYPLNKFVSLLKSAKNEFSAKKLAIYIQPLTNPPIMKF